MLLSTDNGPPFPSKFFLTECSFLGVKHLTTTAHHLQTNGQVDRYKKTIATRLCHLVAEHQRDWDTSVQPLKIVYYTQVPCVTKTTPHSHVLSGHPPGPSLSPQRQTHDTDVLRDTSIQATQKVPESQFRTLQPQTNKRTRAPKSDICTIITIWCTPLQILCLETLFSCGDHPCPRLQHCQHKR